MFWNAARFATLMLIATTPALAQVTSAQQDAIRSSCRSDFMSKCPGVPRGGKEALQCLQKNVGSLSPACKTAVSATIPAAPTAPAAAAAPAAPAATAAPAAPASAPATAMAPAAPKPAAAAAPVVAKPAQPPKSAAPKAPAPKTAPAPAQPPVAPQTAVASPPPAAQPPKAPIVNAAVMVRACKLDLLRHCSDVGVGDGRKLACLTEHKSSLTVGCRTALNITEPLR